MGCMRLSCVLLTVILTLVLRVQAAKCPADCKTYGVCQEDQGRCDCPRHRSGPSCGILSIDCDRKPASPFCPGKSKKALSCLNGCNRHGRCVAGWCHCHAGYFGADCSLSTGPDGHPVLLKDEGYLPNTKGPYVYVYELPPQYNVWLTHSLDRPLYHLFWQRLLSSGHRVADPEQADYFYVPVALRLISDTKLLLEVVDFIRTQWPYWDRYAGARHLFVHMGDCGRCELHAAGQKLTENSTWLTHLGLHSLPGQDQTGDAAYLMSQALCPSEVWPPLCHRPGQDIVLPVYITPGSMSQWGLVQSPLHPEGPKTPKDITFFFSGRICGDRKDPSPTSPSCSKDKEEYSKGVRARVHELYHNRSGYRIVPRSPTYGQEMARSLFCLAPLGAGYGKRQVLVSLLGCIPVVIGDDVLQPFEPEMDWSQFAVRVPESDVHKMADILDGMSSEEIQAKQAALPCAAKHLMWSSIYGAIFDEDGRYDAFATVMETLRMMKLYPGIPPEQYRQKDEKYRLFMECRSPDGGTEVRGKLCSMADFPSGHKCSKLCKGKALVEYWYPGGAACCGTENLAQCSRQGAV